MCYIQEDATRCKSGSSVVVSFYGYIDTRSATFSGLELTKPEKVVHYSVSAIALMPFKCFVEDFSRESNLVCRKIPYLLIYYTYLLIYYTYLLFLFLYLYIDYDGCVSHVIFCVQDCLAVLYFRQERIGTQVISQTRQTNPARGRQRQCQEKVSQKPKNHERRTQERMPECLTQRTNTYGHRERGAHRLSTPR